MLVEMVVSKKRLSYSAEFSISTSGSFSNICLLKPNWVIVINLGSCPSAANRIWVVRALFSNVESMASLQSAEPIPFAGEMLIQGLAEPATQSALVETATCSVPPSGPIVISSLSVEMLFDTPASSSLHEVTMPAQRASPIIIFFEYFISCEFIV